ncbi:peptidylprolyl isomerase [Nonomuraea terrae]|uniref:peptidylprolyl isomerase n=1 Tax=Nonomuraea terrae TaxID=2530383 RepID=UPI0037A777C0
MPTDDHVHTPGSGSAAVIGWVDDHPIPRDRLDQRLDELRNGPLRSALPVPGTSEDRQLARWVTQVILTEALCEATAADLGLSPEQATERDGCTPARSSPPVGGSEASWRLDRVAAVELGSINAAAYHGSPWARAVFHHVTASASVPPEWRRSTSSGRRLRSSERSPRHLVRHRLFDDPARARDATEADLESLGPVELDSLPTAIAEALNSHPYGTLVGPVVDALGWHVAMATPVHPAPASATLDGNDHDSSLVEAARRKAFARWLDDMRAKRVRLVPGFEHPGDPRQPDNHHKH